MELSKDSQVEATRWLPNNVLSRILKFLYLDFLKSDESTTIGKHHCSLLHPCVSISKSKTFNVFCKFRLVASKWNKVFLSTAKLDQYASYGTQDPLPSHTWIYRFLLKSVIFGKYRVFHSLDNEHGTCLGCVLIFFLSLTRLDYRGVFVAYDFGVTGGCEKSRKVIIKAWRGNYQDDYIMEREVYNILLASPSTLPSPTHSERIQAEW